MSVIIVRVGEKTLKIYLPGPVSYRDFRETAPRDGNQQQTSTHICRGRVLESTRATLVGGGGGRGVNDLTTAPSLLPKEDNYAYYE